MNEIMPRRAVVSISILLIVLFLVLFKANGVIPEERDALVDFMAKLSPGNVSRTENWGWNSTSDPCDDLWRGVNCSSDSTVKKIVLEGINLTGVLDAVSLCKTTTLMVLSLSDNNLTGLLPAEISNCSRLTHIYLRGNKLSGSLPGSLSGLGNLRRLDVADNGFFGSIPDLSRLGLLTFWAENNRLSGAMPRFDFSSLREFNVSNNDLRGAIPDGGEKFNQSSYSGNPGLCGKPLLNACPPPPPPAKGKGTSKKDYFIYSGYALIGVIIVLVIVFTVIKRCKTSKKESAAEKGVTTDRSQDKVSSTSSASKANPSEFSITSGDENGRGSSSLVVLSDPLINGLKFDDLLRSPAEVMGRNKRGTLYKAILNDRLSLVVKRTRDWEISRDDFKMRIQRIHQVKHPNVLPIVAFYSSKHEKLLVYEFQENGSLFKLLQGSQNGEYFDWGRRLNVAAKISAAVAAMHEGLREDRIAHGNLKSSNILFSSAMEPLVSEYGLAEVENHCDDQSSLTTSHPAAFRADVYRFGIVLLELLTGKLSQSDGGELAGWVSTAIREEWTVEVFDKALVGASEERMVSLLQVALKCINGGELGMREVAQMIGAIKEEDERSISYDP